MPIYEYQCSDCGHRLEALQKISDAPLQDCPQCKVAGLVRLISASSFRLKGGGWYETDFKTGAKRHGTQDASAESAGPAVAAKAEPGVASSATVASTVKPAAV
ncbi:MAG: zinc ribbon domain-containing protein [Pseudomonadota bacterium]